MYTDKSPLLSIPDSTVDKAISAIVKRDNGEYTDYDVSVICNHYWRIASSVGLNPVLMIAQCLHETAALSSWWAARPRRNPAGIGVTGVTQPHEPTDKSLWAWNEKTGLWHKGLSFPTWEQGITVHCAHLLCYVLADKEMTCEQLAFSEKSPRKKALPASYRGAAKQLNGLNGKWAVPGRTYAAQIAKLSNILI